MELEAESVAQAVEFSVEVGVDEFSPALLSRLVEVNFDIAQVALQFGHDRSQRVGLAVTALSEVVGAVHPDHQDAAALEPPPQSEQQAQRRRVRPLQVIQNEHERGLLAQSSEHVDVLLEDLALFD